MNITTTDAGDDFQSWWRQEGEWVEAPNIRRGGQSGVQKLELQQGLLYAKRQTGHIYRSLIRPWGEPTIMREARAYKSFVKLGVKVAQVEYAGARNIDGQSQALLVTHALVGFCELDQWYQQNPSQAQRSSMLEKLALMLKNMHRGRWQHGCLYAKHVFVKSEGANIEVALLDLEKCRRRLVRTRASNNDLRQLKRHKGLMPDQDYAYLHTVYQGLC